MAHYWLKLYTEILDDPKMGQMPDNLWRRTIELFAAAKEYNKDGHLPHSKDLAWRLRVDHDALLFEMGRLAALGILTPLENEVWIVTKFAERQGPSPVKQRVAEHRERKRKEQEAGNADVTESYNDSNAGNTPETEAETDTETDKDSGADAQDKPLTGRNLVKAELQAYFCERAKMRPPPTKTKKDRTGASTRWWKPLLAIGALVDDDIEAGKILIDAAIAQMDREGLTLSAPQSIVKIAESINGKLKRGISLDGSKEKQWTVPDYNQDKRYI